MGSTKQLFVLRHAKSSWEDPGLDDHERPLAPRGRKAVALLAEHLRESDIRPALVLCSTARRTRETLDGIAVESERLIEDELYDASAQSLLERLRQVPDELPSVMVIGHNPAIQMLVLRLAEDQDGSAPLMDVRRKFPTGALATLDLHCGWSELEPGCARLVAFVRPKVLRRK